MFVCKLVCSTYKSVVLLTYSFLFLWFLIEIPTALPSFRDTEYRRFTFTFQFRQEDLRGSGLCNMIYRFLGFFWSVIKWWVLACMLGITGWVKCEFMRSFCLIFQHVQLSLLIELDLFSGFVFSTSFLEMFSVCNTL